MEMDGRRYIVVDVDCHEVCFEGDSDACHIYVTHIEATTGVRRKLAVYEPKFVATIVTNRRGIDYEYIHKVEPRGPTLEATAEELAPRPHKRKYVRHKK